MLDSHITMHLRIFTWLVTKYTEARQHKSLGIFGRRLLADPYLFHLNERSVPGAFAVGLFCAWIPLPPQMIFAATAAIIFRVNLPLSALLVWVTNPVTIPPMFYFAYLVGVRITGGMTQDIGLQFNMEWMKSGLHVIGEPLLIGCAILGVSSSLIGYITVRALWNERLSKFLHIKIERRQRILKRRILKR